MIGAAVMVAKISTGGVAEEKLAAKTAIAELGTAFSIGSDCRFSLAAKPPDPISPDWARSHALLDIMIAHNFDRWRVRADIKANSWTARLVSGTPDYFRSL